MAEPARGVNPKAPGIPGSPDSLIPVAPSGSGSQFPAPGSAYEQRWFALEFVLVAATPRTVPRVHRTVALRTAPRTGRACTSSQGDCRREMRARPAFLFDSTDGRSVENSRCDHPGSTRTPFADGVVGVRRGAWDL